MAEGANQSNFDAGFEMNYAWSFQSQLKSIFSGDAAASSIFTTDVQEYYSVGENQAKLRFTTNHDIYAWDETPQSAYVSTDGATAAAVIAAYLNAAALIYNGQEVALNRSISFFSKNPINWNANPATLAQYNSFMSYYSSSEAAKKGSITKYNSVDAVSFVKQKDSDKLLVTVNVRNDTVVYNLPSVFVNQSAQNALTTETVQLDSVLTLMPFEYLILKL